MMRLSQPIHDMLLYGVALLLLRGASLITLPAMTYFLSVEQIGQLELIAVTQTFFALLISLAMHENLYRFVATLDQADDQKVMVSRLYTTALTLSLGLVIILVVPVWLFSANLVEGAWHYFSHTQVALMASVWVIQSSLEISLAWLRLQNKAWTFFKLSVFCTCLQVSLIFMVVYLVPSVTAVLMVGVFCAFVQLAILHYHNRFDFKLLNGKTLGRYLKYCTPIMFSALVAFGLNGGERWLLMQANNFEFLAQYAIALKFALAVGILLQPFHMWWMPKRFAYWQDKGAITTSRISQYGIVYACVLAVLVTWGGKLFIELFLPNQYQTAANLVALAVMAMLFKEIAEITNIGLLKSKQTQALFLINLIVTISALMIIWAVNALFSQHTLWIVCLGVAIAQLIRCFIIAIASQRSNPLPYQTSKLVTFILLTIALLASNWLTNELIPSMTLLLIESVALLLIAHFHGLLHLPVQDLRKVLRRIRV